MRVLSDAWLRSWRTRPILRRLTRRQWEIAQLLAEGLSNKEIAARLVISPRTAETHVENILTKLGFTSRAQASRWVIDQRDHRSGSLCTEVRLL